MFLNSRRARNISDVTIVIMSDTISSHHVGYTVATLCTLETLMRLHDMSYSASVDAFDMK